MRGAFASVYLSLKTFLLCIYGGRLLLNNLFTILDTAFYLSIIKALILSEGVLSELPRGNR
ncbi:hypothetical protein BC829DRAFT_393432 [Chytridium lagenaria]|nr:hypothetical protein BC829DRAFT_393432 [Chytridium lagenaria]